MNGSRLRSWILAGCLSAGAFFLGGSLIVRAAERNESDFAGILAEMRNAVAHTSDMRTRADRTGDRVKETCAYERLRGMMQSVESTQIAQVAWEGAKARGDEAAAAQELQRAQQALELVRRMRNEADNCIGRELATVSNSGTTTVTVESTVRDDDPNAGPPQSWVIAPPALNIPDRPLPASPF